MQDNEERKRRTEERQRCCSRKKGNDAAAANASGEGEAAKDEDRSIMTIIVIVPTKTEDGGSSNQEQAHINQNQEHETTSARPDAFTTYSDDNMRMLTLLGLEPNDNPNEGEQEDWRQLTGFTGLGRRIIEDEDGNGTTPRPRKTRLSFELHPDVFTNMWFERGELGPDDDDAGHGQPPRQQQQDHDEISGSMR